MIIDEISMTDLSMLSKIAKSLDRNSPDLFGGLPTVIFMGDFYQFPPVRGPALWTELATIKRFGRFDLIYLLN